MFDVCVVGAGVVGMNIARELSRYQASVCVLEKGNDVSQGCSKANSGIVHGGYSDEPGTEKAYYCVRGNRMYRQLEEELHFGYRETGSFVLAFRDEDLDKLQRLYENGITNGVGGLELLNGEEVRRREPHVSEKVRGALYCRDAGVTSPYEFVIALAENAVANGVELYLNYEVTGIQKKNEGGFLLTGKNPATGEEQISVSARFVINAAGLYGDRIAGMVGLKDFSIHPRRGQYVILDKSQNYLAKSVIFQVPTEMGKGILVTTTYHGNLMIGPNAEDIDDREDVGTDKAVLEEIVATARLSVPGIDMKKALTSFAGNRPVTEKKDFFIGQTAVPGFIYATGIDSPGLTSSPAIAQKIVAVLQEAGVAVQRKADFQPFRKGIVRHKDGEFAGTVDDTDPELRIVCRCEKVTEAEIVDALYREISIPTVEGIKRRTRAGMGTCQGAFCGPRVKEVIARVTGVDVEQVPVRGSGSSQLHRVARGEMIALGKEKE